MPRSSPAHGFRPEPRAPDPGNRTSVVAVGSRVAHSARSLHPDPGHHPTVSAAATPVRPAFPVVPPRSLRPTEAAYIAAHGPAADAAARRRQRRARRPAPRRCLCGRAVRQCARARDRARSAIPSPENSIDWCLLRGGAAGRPARSSDFLADNPGLAEPRPAQPARRGSAATRTGGTAKDIKAFFDDRSRAQASGRLPRSRRPSSATATGQRAKLAAWAWRDGDIPTLLENGFIERFGKLLDRSRSQGPPRPPAAERQPLGDGAQGPRRRRPPRGALSVRAGARRRSAPSRVSAPEGRRLAVFLARRRRQQADGGTSARRCGDQPGARRG